MLVAGRGSQVGGLLHPLWLVVLLRDISVRSENYDSFYSCCLISKNF